MQSFSIFPRYLFSMQGLDTACMINAALNGTLERMIQQAQTGPQRSQLSFRSTRFDDPCYSLAVGLHGWKAAGNTNKPKATGFGRA